MKREKSKVKKYRRGAHIIIFNPVRNDKPYGSEFTFKVDASPELTQYLLDNTKRHIVKYEALYFAKEALFNMLSFRARSKKNNLNTSYIEHKAAVAEKGYSDIFDFLSKKGHIPLMSDIEQIIKLSNVSNNKKDIKGISMTGVYVVRCTKCNYILDHNYLYDFTHIDDVFSKFDFTEWQIKDNAVICNDCINVESKKLHSNE